MLWKVPRVCRELRKVTLNFFARGCTLGVQDELWKPSVSSFICSFIQQPLTEDLLCARHIARLWRDCRHT